MIYLKLLLIGLIGSYSVSGFANAKLVNCYYNTCSNYRPGDGKFEPSNIDPKLCTHISYSFFDIAPNGEFKILDQRLDLDNGLGYISKTIELKRQNPSLKVLAVVGSWSEGSTKYSCMASDANKRKIFIQSALKFIQEHGFDGLDLDLEYPCQCDDRAQDKVNFVALLKEIKEAFEPYDLELSIAVSASPQPVYDIPNISKYVDFINVMTFDFAEISDGKVGFNAPLKGQGENNVESSIKYWLQQGAPASKLNLGLAFYGSSFTLANAQQTTAGSPINGSGTAGPFSREAGYMGYNEICSLEKSWNNQWSSENKVPYIYNGNQWIGYDNPKSIELKVEFANAQNLGGVMIWSIEFDDFLGKCGSKYPLLNAINNKLNNSKGGDQKEVETSTVPPPYSPSTTVKPELPSSTTAKPNKPLPNDCSVDGFFADPTDCTRFYRCVNGGRYNFVCGPGLYFDASISACNWPYLVPCNKPNNDVYIYLF